MSGENEHKCGNCGAPGIPLNNIPDADKLVEIPVACQRCIQSVPADVLTKRICGKVSGIVLRPYRQAIIAELSKRRVS
jgi:hypothetical protein